MRTRRVVIAVAVLIVVVIAVFRFLNSPRKLDYVFYPMGGIPCMIAEYEAKADKFAEDVRQAELRVSELEDVFNRFRETSEVSRLNRLEAGKWYPASREMYEVLERSLIWYGRSGGAFDVTVTPLIRLWKGAGERKSLPTGKELASALSRVGSSSVILSPEKGVMFAKSGVELDLGGIAKGYIIGEMAKLLLDRGVDKFVFSCGGDVVLKGKKAFRVGIKEPGGGEDDLMMVLNMPEGSVVTSGHYERFVEIGGKRYSHIIDPATGRPVENDLESITILNDDPMDADALATAVAVVGFEKAADLIKKTGSQAVLLRKVGEGYEIHCSKELDGRLEYKGKWGDVPKVIF